MAEGEARVRLRVVGRREVEREVQRAARGVTREAKKAEQERVRAERQAARERLRVAQQAAREEARNARAKARREALVQREIIRLVRDAERAKRREQSRTVREAIRNSRTRAREEERALRERARAEQRAAVQAERGRAARRGAILTTVGATAVGLGAAGISASQRAQGVLGIPTKDEALRSFIGFRQQLLQTGSEAGLSDADIERLQQQILSTSRGTNIDPNELLAGLQTAQGRFDKLESFRANLDAIARVSKASGAGLDEVIGAAGEAQRQFGLTNEELEEFLNTAFLGARRGSIEFKDLAANFSGVFASGAASLGRRGIAGARETLALSQVIGTGEPRAAEAATITERTLETLLDREAQQRFRRVGIDVAESDGRLRPLNEIAQALARNPALNDPRKLQEVVGSRIEARRGIRILRQRAIDNPELFGNIQNISAAEGASQIGQTVNRLMNDPSGRAQAMGIERLASIFEDGGRLTETMEGLAGPLTELENEFPLLTSAVEELRPVLYALIGSLAFNRLTGGGGGGIAGSLLGRGAGTALAGAGGSGAAATAGGVGLGAGAAVVGGVAALAGVGYHLYDTNQRLNAMEAVRNAQISDVESRLTNARSPAELDAALAADPRTNPGGRSNPVPSGGDLTQLPFFQQRTPTVQLSEEDRRLLRSQGVTPVDERRGPGGGARRTP